MGAGIVGAGSSPRVRGKHPACAFHCSGRGLIPACAGKTGMNTHGVPAKRAHPRVCGENISGALVIACVRGSSPRVRGKPTIANREDYASRLIPACAGKTMMKSPERWITWAHPRVCGENYNAMQQNANAAGSSPRVRGKLGFLDASCSPDRLIPACAGKT